MTESEAWARAAGRPLRVLHCPWNIAGQSAELAAAERSLGADSRCVVIEETAIGFPADERLMAPGGGVVARESARWRLLWRAMTWADVVHFSFGQSCLVPHAFPSLRSFNWLNPARAVWRLYARAVWLKDLPLLARLGRKLVVTWQGDDARQSDRSLELFAWSLASELGDEYYVPNSDHWKRRTIDTFARYVPVQYALNPDLLHVLPRSARFMPYASLDPARVTWLPPPADTTRPVAFAHAPSHRGAKGTKYVLAAAERLRAEGIDFTLDLVEGISRQQAMQRYAKADVIIDQLIAGWYGGLGVEAMALGKPLVSFIRQGDLVALAPKMRSELPVLSATPESIAEAMKQIIAMPRHDLQAWGQRSRSFVEHWHSPRKIASQTLADYVRVHGATGPPTATGI
ncbi:MAG: glycosyltransferase [Hyphomicrobiaceae bacterium]